MCERCTHPCTPCTPCSQQMQPAYALVGCAPSLPAPLPPLVSPPPLSPLLAHWAFRFEF